jgi:signal transduction histidine kinase
MGSRSRSIRLRIYFLVAIPLIAMVGLLAYVVGTSVNNAISLDRVPNLINASGIPAAKFGVFTESERAAAVVYLSEPTKANLAAYRAAITATNQAEPAFTAAMTSPAVAGTESSSGAKQIQAIFGGLKQLPTLRSAIQARLLSPLAALAYYSQGPATTTKLFLIQTESVVATDQLGPAVGLIATVQAREQLSQEHALLAGMLAGRRITLADRVAFTNMAAARQANLQDADNLLGPAALAAYNAQKAGSGAMQQDLTNIEQAIAAGTPVSKLPVTAARWRATAGTLLTDYFNGGVAVTQAIMVADHKISHAAWVRVAAVSVVGLLGLLITILVTTLVARGIIRRLGGLERNALQLAEVQLPDVVGRLRRGEEVDVASEAPPLRVGRDEIGRVGQAFDLVRQTAIGAAVEEAKLRRGLNDVFRSLARRSQSLLHRQLALLDQMERRATDPEALDDLFRLDHLTTRMRRHAEGLVILAGASPGRGWSSPVRMVDVMRGAIAEVEDYARVSVATRSQAALAGPAVADVIHLLAELIENATTLSPPYTSVRVAGDTVANGFAIEVEDRGLGMSPPRLAELNDRLSNPPEFNPSDSEQLGLFVVSQLAERHGIRVTLKASPYGGTAAIVLIPHHLVVTEEAFRAGLPGEPAMAQLTANGNHAVPMTPAELAGQGGSGFTQLGGGLPGLAQTPGVRISGPLRRSQGIIPERMDRGAHAASIPAPALGPANGPGNGTAGTGPDDLPRRHHDQPAAPAGGGLVPKGAGAMPFGSAPSAFDVFMPRSHGQGAGQPPAAAQAGPGSGAAAPATEPSAPHPGSGSYIASPSYPASGSSPYPGPGAGPASGAGTSPFPGTGAVPIPGPFPGSGSPSYPGPDPASYPDQPAPFPGWTRHNPPGASGGRTAGPGAPAGPTTAMTPVASSRPGQAAAPPWELPREAGPLPAVSGRPAAGPDMDEPDGNSGIKGLPRRVRQASLAPQLRASPPQRRTTVASADPSSGPSPAEIRQTMSSLQRGWQEGRSQRMVDPASGEPPRAPSAARAGSAAGTGSAAAASLPLEADQGSSPSGRAHDSTADEQARGGSDGS